MDADPLPHGVKVARRNTVTTDILNGGGLPRVQRAIREGVFRNPEDLTRAYKLAEGMTKDGAALDGMLKGSSAKAILDTIKKRTASKKDLSRVFDDGSMSSEGLQAQTDFRLQILAWRQANPEAGIIEQEEAVAKLGSTILNRIFQTDTGGAVLYDRRGFGGPNTFGSLDAASDGPEGPAPLPDDSANLGLKQAPRPAYGNPSVAVPSGLPGVDDRPAPAPAPVQTAPAQAAPAPTPPASPAPSSVSTASNPGDWFNGLPPESRALIERKAAEEKKPLTLKTQELYGRAIERGFVKPAAPGKQSALDAPTGPRAPNAIAIETVSTTAADDIGQSFREAIDAPPSPDRVRMLGEAFERAIAATGKPVGGYVSAQLRDDPKAARILDFVAGPESGGSYNAIYGNAGSTKDLSVMSLDEVTAWSGNRGTASSATGRYQFMQSTLRDLKGSLGLSGSERFTPELQDRLALALLERRGYSEWQAGKITDAEFGNRLALEWAALPNITPQNGRAAGQSAYAGDGLNRSLVSPVQVMAALKGTDTAPTITGRPGIMGRVAGLFRRGGGTDSSPQQTTPAGYDPRKVSPAYDLIPDVDGKGQAGQKQKFMEWNPDPVGNNERVLSSVSPTLASVIRKAQQDNPGLRFVAASGHRDDELQKKAVKWGWSKTNDSNHEHGDALDVWVLNDKGQVVFDQRLQEQAAAAIKKAAGELGTGIRWGGDFKTFKDRPHFELTGERRA